MQRTMFDHLLKILFNHRVVCFYICFFWYEHIEEIWPIILLFSSYMLHVKDSYFLNCGCLPPTVNSSETEIIKV